MAELVTWHEGPIYLICEDDVVDFFRRLGFVLIPMSEMLTGLQSKWQRYIDPARAHQRNAAVCGLVMRPTETDTKDLTPTLTLPRHGRESGPFSLDGRRLG